jgi:hypothetical protein
VHHVDTSDELYEYPLLEIAGLNLSTNGRSCAQHDVCGKHVRANDVLRLVECVVTVGDKTEQAIKLVKIEKGAPT